MGKKINIVYRLLSNVYCNVATKCIVWLGCGNKQRGDYGLIYYNGVCRYVHIVVYELVYGKVSKHKVLDHICRNHRCINIFHLEIVTNEANILRGYGWAGINARKTECPKGHKYTVENTYIQPKGGYRICKICKKEHEKNRHR